MLKYVVRSVANSQKLILTYKTLFWKQSSCTFSNSSLLLSNYEASSQVEEEEDDGRCVLEFKPNIRRLKLITFNDKIDKTEEEIEDKFNNQSTVASVINRPIIPENDPYVQEMFKGILRGERSFLARGITLIESIHPVKRAQGQLLVKKILEKIRINHNHSFNHVSSFRIGLSGPPGAGKSTHIETLGKMLTEKNHKVAVLAVDPSSSTTGGSLLGDKTRMLKLAVDPKAYIRPSPTSGNLGGVTRVTNDAIVLCEGAGYDIIIVETVGVGQSEFAVADMVDLFELLLPPAGGDELQGIKKGIVEVADMVVVNKSDGDLVPAARRIQTEYLSAMKFIRPKSPVWKPSVLRVSSVTGEGMEELWEKMSDFRKKMSDSGDLQRIRTKQYVKWMHDHIQDSLRNIFHELPHLNQLIPDLEVKVRKGIITPGQASDKVMRHFIKLIDKNLASEGMGLDGKVTREGNLVLEVKGQKKKNVEMSNC